MIPFIDFQKKDYWIPNHGSDLGKLAQFYLWIHTCLGWLFGTFAVAADGQPAASKLVSFGGRLEIHATR